jgi:hypothetical protein
MAFIRGIVTTSPRKTRSVKDCVFESFVTADNFAKVTAARHSLRGTADGRVRASEYSLPISGAPHGTSALDTLGELV